MSTGPRLDEIRDRMKALGLFDHDGYSGPATKHLTITVRTDQRTMRDRFLIIGAPDGSEWQDDVDSVIRVLQEHGR